MSAENPRNGSPYSKQNQVSVASTATLILAGIAMGSRKSVTLLNIDATNTIYIGNDATVTTANGFPLIPGASLTREYNQATWGISGAGTPKIAYITEEGV